jgi:hypothetical protein
VGKGDTSATAAESWWKRAREYVAGAESAFKQAYETSLADGPETKIRSRALGDGW